MDKSLESRRERFEDYTRRARQGFITVAHLAERYPCPCCGYPTLKARMAGEVCLLCDWQDNGQDDRSANEVWGGFNGPYSLADARRDFECYLALTLETPDRSGSTAGAPSRMAEDETPTERVARCSTIEAFDRLLGSAAPRQEDGQENEPDAVSESELSDRRKSGNEEWEEVWSRALEQEKVLKQALRSKALQRMKHPQPHLVAR